MSKRKAPGPKVATYCEAAAAMGALDAPIAALEGWARGRHEVSEADWLALQDIIRQLRSAQHQQFVAVVGPQNEGIDRTSATNRANVAQRDSLFSEADLWRAVDEVREDRIRRNTQRGVKLDLTRKGWKEGVAGRIAPARSDMRWATVAPRLREWGLTEEDIKKRLRQDPE